jgi:hypothetical protein
MTVPASSIKLADVRNEFGGVGSYSLADAAAETINNCSSGGDQVVPYVLGNWAGYDHTTLAPAPTDLAFHPGSTATQDGNAFQDSNVYITWGPIICVDSFDLLSATSCGGTYSVILNDTAAELYNWSGVANNNGASTWLKLRGISGGVNGNLSACLEVKSAPTKPVSPTVSVVDSDCNNVLCTMNWTNGTSPGVRSSKISYRWAKNGTPAGAYTTSVGSYGDVSFQVNVGVGADTDTFSFEWYYNEEGSSQTVSATSAGINCFV